MEENSNIVPGTDGGQHVSGTPLTTTLSKQASPDLILNAIDRRIVKVRPMSTPLDQLSRSGKSRKASGMQVEYYSVDTKRTESELKSAVDYTNAQEVADGQYLSVLISTQNDNLFEPTETIMLPGIKGIGNDPVTGYIESRKDNGLQVTLLNLVKDSTTGKAQTTPIGAGSKIVRMGRAACELDVQTAQFAALPQKRSNFCQIFKMQIEQSTMQKIADKEVNWTFSDQEEAAIIDMRLGMEKNFLFGSKAKLQGSMGQEVYLTGGVWAQAGREYSLGLSKLNENDLISLCSKAFTQNAGSKQKILMAGTKMLEAISKLTFNRSLTSTDTQINWGVEFKEIRSNFGSLLVVHSEIFDQCGREKDGLIIDPAYVTKYVSVPFKVDRLDLRSSGQRNTDAVVITEASCLVLRYPDSHIRVIGI